MPVNLAWASALASKQQNDACIITRDPLSTDDDTFNYQTGVATVRGSSTIYTGTCQISVVPRLAGHTVEGNYRVTISNYHVALPLAGSPEILVGDLVTITSSTRDPALVGKVLRVMVPRYTTLQVTRRFEAELRD